jgi:diguanylate cyclase (GGDEF)-like protein
VEDNPGDARLIEIMLNDSGQSGFKCKRADRLKSALEAVEGSKFDVVLLDLALPDSFGLDSFSKISAADPKLPVVVLTGNDDETIALTAVREGAQDYIVKGQFDEKLLVRAINYAIERQKTVLQLHTMSYKDELTGLNNRRGFMIQTEELMNLCRRNSSVLTVFFIDLDGMKWINDTLGHKEGDTALIDTADIIRSCFRESDVLARLGGDEFAASVLMDDDAGIDAVTKRIREKVKKLNDSGLRNYELSLSIGNAVYTCGEESAQALLNKADAMMYEDKKKNKKAR